MLSLQQVSYNCPIATCCAGTNTGALATATSNAYATGPSLYPMACTTHTNVPFVSVVNSPPFGPRITVCVPPTYGLETSTPSPEFVQ